MSTSSCQHILLEKLYQSHIQAHGNSIRCCFVFSSFIIFSPFNISLCTFLRRHHWKIFYYNRDVHTIENIYPQDNSYNYTYAMTTCLSVSFSVLFLPGLDFCLCCLYVCMFVCLFCLMQYTALIQTGTCEAFWTIATTQDGVILLLRLPIRP